MSEIVNALQILKRLLKANGISYGDIAKSLRLSEATIKRLFSIKNFDLRRLEKICELVDISMTDLFLMAKKSQVLTELSHEQEEALIGDIKLLLVAICVITGWRFNEILHHYHLTHQECVEKLLYLDKMKIIDLLPNNKYKLKISSNFSWRANGPVLNFFQNNLQQDFFSGQFLKEEEALVARFGRLTNKSILELQKKFNALAETFTKLVQEDTTAPLNERHSTALVIGIRPWFPKLFEQFKRIK